MLFSFSPPSCGFRLTRMCLLTLNVIYVIIGIVLIMCGCYAKRASLVTSPSIYGGVIVAGVFLTAVSLLGIYGTRRHSQPALFFYMVILFIVFLIQFFVSIGCLSNESNDYVDEVVSGGWHSASNESLWFTQKTFACCGLHTQLEGVGNCHRLKCWSDRGCPPCIEVLGDLTRDNLGRVGALGLLFSFTELAGVWLARHYRNLQNPRFNPETLFYN